MMQSDKLSPLSDNLSLAVSKTLSLRDLCQLMLPLLETHLRESRTFLIQSFPGSVNAKRLFNMLTPGATDHYLVQFSASPAVFETHPGSQHPSLACSSDSSGLSADGKRGDIKKSSRVHWMCFKNTRGVPPDAIFPSAISNSSQTRLGAIGFWN